MVSLPSQPPVTMDEIIQWHQMSEQLAKLRAAEMVLRKRIFDSKFPTPVEGTNTTPMHAGWVMKAVHKLDRKLDMPAFELMLPEFQKAGFYGQELVERKPELKIRPYRELTEEQRQLFDQCLIIKPGAPSLSIEQTAAAKKAAKGD